MKTVVSAAVEPPTDQVEKFDVVVVGAGISGVDAAYHLTHHRPGTTYVVLEGLESFGGTWLMHRYPGIRSDSDLYTFGYGFKPWTGPPIATAEEILSYMGEVIEENGLSEHIRYRHRINSAEWSSEDRTWTIVARDEASGRTTRFRAGFLWMCQGYYRHAEGFTPDGPGMDDYEGRIVHPQTWPDDLDLSGQQVVVIGSGATAATLVPAIAGDCAHVTVVQRSPTYFYAGPNSNEVADMLRELEIDETWIHEIVRRKIISDQGVVTRLAFEEPEFLRDVLIDMAKERLPEGYDVATHFTPTYLPWRQRIAYLPDGDLFAGISAGLASMVTGEIECFTPKGLRMRSGEEIAADVIITATGFNLSVLGDIEFTVDGEAVDFAKTVTYRGMMFTGVPNLVWIMGYFRASWTLRADLVCDFVCRLLDHMDARHVTKVTPHLRPRDEQLERLDWMADDNFNPGYLMRSMHLMPRRLDVPEWQHTQDYWTEKDVFPAIDLDDGCLLYE